MKRSKFGSMLITLAVLSACGGTSNSIRSDEGGGSIEDPIIATYEEVFDSKLSEKYVTIEGYLYLEEGHDFTGLIGAILSIFPRPNQFCCNHISAVIKMGNCNNCVAYLRPDYEQSELKIKDQFGVEIHQKERVRLTGRLSKNSNSPDLYVSKIEKIPEISFDYNAMNLVKINSENLGDTTLGDSLVFAECTIEIPRVNFFVNKIGYAMLSMKGVSGFGINVHYGKGPNQIEPSLDEGHFTDKIRDHKGDLIDVDRPVKVWGTMLMSRWHSRGSLFLERIEQ